MSFVNVFDHIDVIKMFEICKFYLAVYLYLCSHSIFTSDELVNVSLLETELGAVVVENTF